MRLVAPVLTVGPAVAEPVGAHAAAAVAAGRLFGPAAPARAAAAPLAVPLVFAAGTVLGHVAHPRQRDAHAWVYICLFAKYGSCSFNKSYRQWRVVGLATLMVELLQPTL